LQLCGDCEERAQQGGAIIVGQFNQPSFLHEATEFDQMTGAFAAVHDPFPFVGAALADFNAVRHGFGALDRPQGQFEFHDQPRVIAEERMSRQLLAKPPVPSHPSFWQCRATLPSTYQDQRHRLPSQSPVRQAVAPCDP
jgi:hypothetical protein